MSKNSGCKKLISTLIITLTFAVAWSQTSDDREFIKRQTNLKALSELETEFKKADEKLLLKTSRTAASRQIINDKGNLGVIYSVDKNGNIIYAYDDNVNAAITGRTDRIRAGGSMGLNLTGKGIEIAVWESGYAFAPHQEFGGRARNANDGGYPTNHGAHTGGTLIATGIDPQAKGMAPDATIMSYTATSMPAEAAAFAAAGGILANNSNSPNGPYGEYDENARGMDAVCYNAPYYLHVKSAGNNGGRYGNIYSNQLAKNLLVVANCGDVLNYTGPSSVSMVSSSTYGPPNDWRVKPDITNNGESVYSCDGRSTTAYDIKTGTSMSTPATAGTVALLQEHYKNLNNVYMRAATAKALLINTSDEVGAHDGPDFRSGWGLVNAQRAAQTISSKGTSSIINELTLNNGGTYTTTIKSNGTTPIVLTVVWNDPAGMVTSGTAPVLVNDLDVRITGNGNTYYPWIMVPNAAYDNYTDAAQKGDNFRDNVEKIEGILPAGTYTVIVSHKGTLSSGSQDFSMVINGFAEGQLPTQYTLSTNSVGQGNVSASPAGGVYNSGTVVSLLATASAGWKFNGWSGSVTDTANPVNIVMNTNKSVTATFIESTNNQAPVANVNGPYSGYINNSIAFESTGSYDPDGSIVGYSWSFGDGGTSSIASPNHTYTTEGTYTVSLTVTDNQGAQSDVSSTVAVVEGGNTIVEEFGILDLKTSISTSGNLRAMPLVVPKSGTITHLSMRHRAGSGNMILAVYDGTATQPGNRIAVTPATTVSNVDGWQQIELESPVQVTANQNIFLAWLFQTNPGIYYGTGTPGRVDAQTTWTSGMPAVWGATASQTNYLYNIKAIYTVQGSGNTPPVANANGPYNGIVNSQVVFSSAGSEDPDGTIASYAWDFGDGSTSTAANPTHTYTTAGTYNISLTVTDNAGDFTVSNTSATIINNIPVLTTIIVSPENAIIPVNTTQQYNAQGYDQNNNPMSITFNWSTTGGTIDVNGLYTAGATAGNYTITATSGTVSGTANVTVQGVPVLTSIVVTPDNASISINSTQQYSAQGYDQNNNPFSTTFNWSATGGTIDINGLYIAGAIAGNYSVTASSGSVSGTASLTVNDVGACTAPQYIENGGYNAGSEVQNNGVKYECRPYPYSGWCNGAAWAYAPGTGAYWTNAWIEVGPCLTVKGTSAIAGLNTDNAVSIYPNPFNGKTTILITITEKSDVEVNIYSTSGQQVAQLIHKSLTKGEHSLEFDGSDLQSGIYLYKVNINNRVYTGNLLKK